MDHKFSVISIDHKDDWEDYSDKIKSIQKNGLPFSIEVSGDEFGIDSKFMVFTETSELLEEAVDLVQIAFQDISEIERREDFNDEQWAEIEESHLIESFKEQTNDKYDFTIFILKDERERTFVYPNFKNVV